MFYGYTQLVYNLAVLYLTFSFEKYIYINAVET